MLALNVALRDKRPQTFATFAAICREAKNAKFVRKKSPGALISLDKSRDEMNATAARGAEFCGTLIGAPRRARKSKIRGADFCTFGASRPNLKVQNSFGRIQASPRFHATKHKRYRRCEAQAAPTFGSFFWGPPAAQADPRVQKSIAAGTLCRDKNDKMRDDKTRNLKPSHDLNSLDFCRQKSLRDQRATPIVILSNNRHPEHRSSS